MTESTEVVAVGNIDVAVMLPGQVSPTSFIPREDLSFEEWEKIGSAIMRVSGSAKWWLGDWLCFGERRYGEMYAQALSETEFKYQTLVNAASVSRRVAPERRLATLSWSHHDAVAKLPPDEQSEWLEKADAKRWNTTELRDALRPPDRPPDPPLQTAADAPPDVRKIEPGPEPREPAVPPDLVQPSVDVSADLEAWSRRRIGLVWQEQHHLELMAKVAKVLAGN